MKNYNLFKFFSTPVFHFTLENYEKLNNELEKYILNLKKKDEKGQTKSNAGGWHSDNFDIVNDPVAKKFAKVFEKYYKKVIIDEMGWKYDSNLTKMEAMWSIINKKRIRDERLSLIPEDRFEIGPLRIEYVERKFLNSE